ncbi:hypothetical protein CFOL_v3_24498, partial [Cephalotus follicularis]
VIFLLNLLLQRNPYQKLPYEIEISSPKLIPSLWSLVSLTFCISQRQIESNYLHSIHMIPVFVPVSFILSLYSCQSFTYFPSTINYVSIQLMTVPPQHTSYTRRIFDINIYKTTFTTTHL